jgi:hypothetical protein
MRCWSAHCSCSASFVLTVAVAAARNKLATTPAWPPRRPPRGRPVARPSHIHLQGADRAAGQFHRHTQGRLQLGHHQRRGDLAPARLGLHIPDRHRAPLAPATMQGAGPSSTCTASARSAWASEALAQVSSSSLPTSMSPAPSASNSSLAAHPRPAGGLRGSLRLGPGWSGCRCSWPGRPVRCASPLSSSLEIASHEGPRLAGAEGARPEATRQWQRWPDPSIARPAIGCDAERRLGWAQVGREGPGVAASGMTVVARPLTLIACSRPEAATPARATLGEAGQQPPERLLTAPLPAPQLADPKEFSAAGWAVSVAYAGHPWKHVPCQSWC